MTISKEAVEEVLGMIEELEEDREFFATRYEDMVEEAMLKNKKLAKLEKENAFLKDRAAESDAMLKLVLKKLDKLSKALESHVSIKAGNKLMSKLALVINEREKITKPITMGDLTTTDAGKATKPKSGVAKLKEDLKTTYGDLDKLV